MRDMKITKREAGRYDVRFCGESFILSNRNASRRWTFEGDLPLPRPVAGKVFRTQREALTALDKWGDEPVMTYNMLNREAGEFPIARRQKGGCCDPATETYHCM